MIYSTSAHCVYVNHHNTFCCNSTNPDTQISKVYDLCFGEQTNYVAVKNIMIDSDSLVMMVMMDDAFWKMCQVETITINHC